MTLYIPTCMYTVVCMHGSISHYGTMGNEKSNTLIYTLLCYYLGSLSQTHSYSYCYSSQFTILVYMYIFTINLKINNGSKLHNLEYNALTLLGNYYKICQ